MLGTYLVKGLLTNFKFRVQRKAARFCICDYKWDSSVSRTLRDLDLDTLETRRERNRLAMLYKIHNSLPTETPIASYITASSAVDLRKET